MTSISVAPAIDDRRFLATDKLVWFDEETPYPAALHLVGVPADQRFGAEMEGTDPDTYAGIYGVRPLQLAAPGHDEPRLIPAAGLTWVGVHPLHRRRGVLSAMMRHHLTETARSGVAVSLLQASEAAIYGRFGYGLGLTEYPLTLSRGTSLTAPGLDAAAGAHTVELTRVDAEGMAERLLACNRVVAAGEPGTLVFADDYFRRIVWEPTEELRDKEPRRVLFARLDGQDVGVAVFRRSHKWEHSRPVGNLDIGYLSGSPPARLTLLRRLLDFDLMATIKVPLVGRDDPLWHWVDSPRSADAYPVDNLWVRLVDLPAAMAARDYEAECEVVVEVVDDHVPANAGTWLVRIRAGDGVVERSSAPAEVALDIRHLGAAWLGTANLMAMARAGVITEHRSGAARELGRALRTDLAATPAPGF